MKGFIFIHGTQCMFPCLQICLMLKDVLCALRIIAINDIYELHNLARLRTFIETHRAHDGDQPSMPFNPPTTERGARLLGANFWLPGGLGYSVTCIFQVRQSTILYKEFGPIDDHKVACLTPAVAILWMGLLGSRQRLKKEDTEVEKEHTEEHDPPKRRWKRNTVEHDPAQKRDERRPPIGGAELRVCRFAG